METVTSVMDQCVISLSLLANIDPDATTHPDLRIWWEELYVYGEPVDLGSKQYAGLVQQQGHPTNCRMSNELDERLIAELQQYKTYCTEEKLDELFLKASQLLDIEPLDNSVILQPIV